MIVQNKPLDSQALFLGQPCNLQRATQAGRKPQGGAPGGLFAEIAGAAACGATRSVTELVREHPAHRPGAAVLVDSRRCTTPRLQEERPGLVGERRELALPRASLMTPALCTPGN